MVDLLAADGFRLALLATAFGFGLRHGVDWDHIAAITDLTSGGRDRRRSMTLATLYALGHAVVVVALGSVAVVAGDFVPDSVDAAMRRVVGVTLVVLGGYVFYGLARQRRGFRMRSRWSLLGGLLRWAGRRARRRPTVVIEHEHDHAHDPGAVHGHGHRHPAAGGRDGGDPNAVATAVRHTHRHRHAGSLPDDPAGATGRGAFGIGVLHGVGAETPTQVVLFVTAASASGPVTGELLLIMFTLGLLVSNTAMALAATTGFLHAARRFWLYASIAAITGGFSVALGFSYLLGLDVLPPMLTG